MRYFHRPTCVSWLREPDLTCIARGRPPCLLMADAFADAQPSDGEDKAADQPGNAEGTGHLSGQQGTAEALDKCTGGSRKSS